MSLIYWIIGFVIFLVALYYFGEYFDRVMEDNSRRREITRYGQRPSELFYMDYVAEIETDENHSILVEDTDIKETETEKEENIVLFDSVSTENAN